MLTFIYFHLLLESTVKSQAFDNKHLNERNLTDHNVNLEHLKCLHLDMSELEVFGPQSVPSSTIADNQTKFVVVKRAVIEEELEGRKDEWANSTDHQCHSFRFSK